MKSNKEYERLEQYYRLEREISRKKDIEISMLTARVAALENMLCPGGSHQWGSIKVPISAYGGEAFYTVRRCQRCGRASRTIVFSVD